MQNSNLPARIPSAFAVSGSKATIPADSQIGITPGKASFADGFPPLTMTPKDAGGIPPTGQDMNGALNQISAPVWWACAGGGFPYNSAFSTLIGGYPKGARLLKADASGYWTSIVENNTTNPDAAGAGWISADPGGLLNTRTFTSSGTYTPTPGTNSVIVEVYGGGGGGGGTTASGASQSSGAGGGGGGAFCSSRLTSGFSGQTMTIGAGGAGGGPGATGVSGGATSFGALLVAGGGPGGPGATATGTFSYSGGGGNGALTTSGNLKNSVGGAGNPGISAIQTVNALGGAGGGNSLGPGPAGTSGNSGGNIAATRGTGGSGAATMASGGGQSGGAGAGGLIVIYEFA